MNRDDHDHESLWRTFFVTIGIGSLLLATNGCGPAEDAPPPNAQSTSEEFRAELSPAPDFESYMMGDLPAPGTPMRDPFGEGAPVVVEDKPQGASVVRRVPAPALRGIIESEGRLVALFDRGAGVEGEVVRGWRVISVGPRTVILERGNRRIERSL